MSPDNPTALKVTLDAARVAQFGRLIEDISGASLQNVLPDLAGALLFSDSAAQQRLNMPRAAPEQILIHDYQAVELLAALPLDVEMPASAARQLKGASCEFDFTLGAPPYARMKTALRCVARADVIGLRPTRFPDPRALGSAGFVRGLKVSQEQIDRYVDLSGDRNPIHSDPAEAEKLGLPAPIVPGLLLASIAQPGIVQNLPSARLNSLKARFMAPLCAEQPFDIALQTRGAGRLRAYFLAQNARALALMEYNY